ncbi:hypothetical protein JNW88_03490 [Micromonospora sp. ATA32]|nr:hypothetical protein [Micromonospora sp. ATA32]
MPDAWPGHHPLIQKLRPRWPGQLVHNPHRYETPRRPHQEARDALDDGVAEVVAFAEALLANPDLPSRIARQGPYNQPDPIRFYTDYPFLNTNRRWARVSLSAVRCRWVRLTAVECTRLLPSRFPSLTPKAGGLGRPRSSCSGRSRAAQIMNWGYRLGPYGTLLVNSGLCSQGEFEAGQVAGAGAVEG